MEPIANFLDEEWESLSRFFSTEEADFMLHLHGGSDCQGGSFPTNMMMSSSDHFFSPNLAEFDDTSFLSSSSSDTNITPQGSANSEGNDVHFDILDHSNHDYLVHVKSNVSDAADFDTMDDNCENLFVKGFLDDVMDDIDCTKGDARAHQSGNAEGFQAMEVFGSDSCKRNIESSVPAMQYGSNNNNNLSSESPKKKSRSCRDKMETKTNTRSRKKRKAVQESTNVKDEEENTTNNGENSCSCSAEDEPSNNTSSISDSKANSNDKTKASRGSATDPQSLYARRRRERINERLRILQNLVPNGTKVDISTMLEEAVHYVKFLQLQIKLLSSDDLWMYAPIAYNGVDMGFYHKLSSAP